MTERKEFDVIIIGGSYAGLSAAMALGRSMRKVLLIDSGMPCNRQTPYSHNFITQDGVKPGDIAEIAKYQVLKYDTVRFVNDLATRGEQTESGFTISTEGGKTFNAKKLIFATGIKDIMPNIKGFADCWGISVIHCPYCHGYEFRNKKTAIFANGEKAFHISSLVNNLTDAITILSSGNADFTDEQRTKLSNNNIPIVEKEIIEIQHDKGQVIQVIFKDGSTLKFDAIYSPVPFQQHTDLPASLGCEFTDQGYIMVDSSQKTSTKGVFACGDNSSMMRSVAYAVASGGIAGSMVNRELTEEMF